MMNRKTQLLMLILCLMTLMLALPGLAQDDDAEATAEPEITESAAPPSELLADATPIRFGETLEGELAAGERNNYRFEGQAGTAIVISMEADFDAFIHLLDSTGQTLATDDDSGVRLNALLNGFVLPENATYIIQAASGDDTLEGSYTLLLDTTEVFILTYGLPSEGVMTLPTTVYEFDGQRDTLIVSFLNAEGFNTNMTLFAPSGREVARSNFADFFGRAARLGPVQLPEDGAYRLVLAAQGAFNLTAFPVFPINIPVEQTATGEFSQRAPILFFSFEPGEVEYMDVIVDTGNSLPMFVTVLNPAALSIGGSFPRGADFRDAYLPNIEMNSTDTHYIMLSSIDPANPIPGSVSVTVKKTTIQSLDSGPLRVSLNNIDNDRGDAELLFTGVAGTTVNLSVDIEFVEPNSEPYVEVTQGDVLLGAFSQNGLLNYVITFDVPEDGLVLVDLQASAEVVMTIGVSIAGG